MTASFACCRPATSARPTSSSIPGNEQNQSVTVGELVVFPDLLLFAEGGRRLLATVEVETGESVNAIEARAEWGVYSKLKVPLHLYVPPASRRCRQALCAEYQIVGRRAVDLHDHLRPGALQHGAPRAGCAGGQGACADAKPSKPVPSPSRSRRRSRSPSRRRPRQAGSRAAETGRKAGAKAKPPPKPSPRRRPSRSQAGQGEARGQEGASREEAPGQASARLKQR